jgi:hypothetical protein
MKTTFQARASADGPDRQYQGDLHGCPPGPEPLIGILRRTHRRGVYPGGDDLAVILTTRRILCVRITGLDPDRHEPQAPGTFTPKRYWTRVLERISWPRASPDFTDYFRAMTPDTIISRHPGTTVIPVGNVESLAVRKVLHFFTLDEDSIFWRITITDRMERTFEFETPEMPYDLLESPRVRKVFGSRLCID